MEKYVLDTSEICGRKEEGKDARVATAVFGGYATSATLTNTVFQRI